ncbi:MULTISPECIES: tripartite tricarboxylate transporter substrate binding protein [unclassified Amycolatopsis]|uniref:Bug family tripartite tricarboxylate transporter substrate binding protein n=1 Tax=unclassified Amycolatopsis TaxID=2618356 RepID=UPI001C69F93B|nr:tripartite tricarboxylate transporter substrate binding protein [Amycolatopsis sp. DSM 110486]QYN20538.1 tripartite tricarboxylate transporter substrate binding protein [Amycolatopsis sp. DSM 110486]
MHVRKPVTAVLGLALVAGAVAGCHVGAASGGTPVNIQFVVDTGPGGGSDVFARELVKMAQQAKLIDDNWPVISKPQGGGLGAMAYMAGRGSKTNVVAAFTSKWVVSGMATGDAPATLDDLTPIAELAEEQQVVAVPSNSPYRTFAEFVADAKRKPGRLVQVGGASSSVDNLVALKYEKDAGTTWKYLSFADGGPRITALLRGDAQMMIGAESDFSEQVAAHQMKIIGVLGSHRSLTYPDVATLTEQGLSADGLPQQLQFRGIAGPPGMSKQAVDYYVGIFAKLVKTPAWAAYMRSEGNATRFITGEALKKQIATFTETMKPLVARLPQGSK